MNYLYNKINNISYWECQIISFVKNISTEINRVCLSS